MSEYSAIRVHKMSELNDEMITIATVVKWGMRKKTKKRNQQRS